MTYTPFLREAYSWQHYERLRTYEARAAFPGMDKLRCHDLHTKRGIQCTTCVTCHFCRWVLSPLLPQSMCESPLVAIRCPTLLSEGVQSQAAPYPPCGPTEAPAWAGQGLPVLATKGPEGPCNDALL